LIVPESTYRLQLTAQFGFAEAAAVMPYLAALGISTVYCSPVLEARRGSAHGYDTTNPTRLSGELGGESAWKTLCDEASRHRMTILVDIVPNHMAASMENPWWRDVLANGRLSPFAAYFDIDWAPSHDRNLRNRVCLPILDRPLDEAVAAGLVRLSLEAGQMVLAVGELSVPLDVRSCGAILARVGTRLKGESRERTLALATQLETIRPVAAEPPADRHGEYARREALRTALTDLLSMPEIAETVAEDLSRTSPRQLRNCLRLQVYELVWWKKAVGKLNYRRFFDINDLVGVRVEEQEVFAATHTGVMRLTQDNAVCGFRIDHIDGLRDPQQYLERLRSLSSDGTRFTVVEKILTGDETLPADWAVEGTTGYDFLSTVNGLFVDPGGLGGMSRLHRRLGGIRSPRTALVRHNKRRVIKALFSGEFNRLQELLLAATQQRTSTTEVSPARLRRALIDATARLPVYRTYVRPGAGVTTDDTSRIHAATSGAPPMEKAVVRDIMENVGATEPDSAGNPAASEFMARWQQTTGAVMAKGFEDTTLYQDSTLLSLNDVGSRPDLHPVPVEEFHDWNIKRVQRWPHTLNCTATHDTKRGEDLRARLNVLTTLPHEWTSIAEDWMNLVRGKGIEVDAPMALLILQTLLGTRSATHGQDDSFRNRMKEYVTKAAREAKTHSSWLEPNVQYEESCHLLVDLALDDAHLCSKINGLGATLEFYGSLLSLSQVLLKVACPGVPDFYQGSELWDLSLVDPDNRRPVDFIRRRHLLSTLFDPAVDSLAAIDGLVADWPSECAKLFVTHRALKTRAALLEVFQRGDYVPLDVEPASGQVCAFSRVFEDSVVVVAVPVRLVPASPLRLPMGYDGWGNATLALPVGVAERPYRNALTGERIEAASAGRLRMADLTKRFPVVLLTGE